MNSSDTIDYKILGFDNQKYIQLQTEEIRKRVSKFHKLYFEIGGKFLFDSHASRVLPGFLPTTKLEIVKSIGEFEVIFCINAEDLEKNRMMSNNETSYWDFAFSMIEQYTKQLGIKPKIAINLIDASNANVVEKYKEYLVGNGYEVYKRYIISGYPNPTYVLGEEGYIKDEYIPTTSNLVLVVGAGSNSGKMSTCLGQIFLDSKIGINSGYTKYETFPIWNLPLNHPVNLAYEAATIDIGDYNMIDPYHKKEYGIDSVNYNRDISAFKIVKDISEKFVSSDSYMKTYKSPTDMGISTSGFAITNDEVVCIASYEEIKRRKDWYYEIIKRNGGDSKWLDMCDSLLSKAEKYIKNKGYSTIIP